MTDEIQEVEEGEKVGFNYPPTKDHGWRDLVIVQGILTERDF